MSDPEAGGPVLHLQTLTHLWLFGQKAYQVGHWTLWVPVPYLTVGWGSGVFAAVWLLLRVLHVPNAGPGMTARFLVPGLLVWWALRVVAVGGQPVGEAWSWVRYGCGVLGGWWRLAWHPDGPVLIKSRVRVGRGAS